MTNYCVCMMLSSLMQHLDPLDSTPLGNMLEKYNMNFGPQVQQPHSRGRNKKGALKAKFSATFQWKIRQPHRFPPSMSHGSASRIVVVRERK